MDKELVVGLFNALVIAGVVYLVFLVSALLGADTPACKWELVLVAFGSALFGWTFA